MTRHFFSHIAALALCSFLSLSSPVDASAASESTDFSQPFVDVVKTTQPSVVSIKAKLKKPHHSWQQHERDGISPEEFWERFFGISPFENRTRPQAPRYAYGSAFIVSSDGYILTNNHIVEDAVSLTIQLQNGKEYNAEKIGADPNTDIAVVKIDETDLPFLKLADASTVRVGEWVLAIGNPLGLQASVSAGIVSAKGRSGLDIVQVESHPNRCCHQSR